MADNRQFDLAAALEAVSKLDTGAQGRPQLEYIDIDRVDPDPKNRAIDKIPELAQNIALVGLQQPLAVRRNPEAEGRYVVISGHRRRAALKSLVDDGEERFRQVPCLVAPDGMSDAMVRLMLLSGNMVTQGLTPAEMAEATKELEDAIYKLKEEGHEFPGKVRDYVAKACGIAGSRVTRLKAIREKLTEPWVSCFEGGGLSESVAYALCKYNVFVQQRAWRVIARAGERNTKDITANEIGRCDFLDGTENCLQREGKPCDRTEERKDFILSASGSYCGGCCANCLILASCERACKTCAEIAERKRAIAAQQKRQDEEEASREKGKAVERVKLALKGWARLGIALGNAEKDARWLANLLDWDLEDMNEWSTLLQGGDMTDDNKYWAEDHPLEGIYVPDLLKLADELGVSLDYLFGRTDSSGMTKAEKATAAPMGAVKPTWQTGRPGHSGLYFCQIRFDEGQTMTINLYRNAYDGRWEHPVDGALVPYEVLGWYPLPEAQDVGEYGLEDDDLAAEAGEVWGAEE